MNFDSCCVKLNKIAGAEQYLFKNRNEKIPTIVLNQNELIVDD